MSQLLRVQNFGVSSDGIACGPDQSFESPFGLDHGEMFAWAGATASWPNRTDPGGSRGLDDYFTRDFSNNIGAEIMGRNKFSPYRGPWENLEWQGWWGDEPPFHTPVFVLTHHVRPSFTLSDTTFHFVDADPRRPSRRHVRQRRARTFDSAAESALSVNSSTPIWSTRCTSLSPRSNSDPVYDCGRHLTSYSTASTSTLCRARAA